MRKMIVTVFVSSNRFRIYTVDIFYSKAVMQFE